MIEYLRSDNSELDITFTAASGITSVIFEAYDLDTNNFIQSGTTSSAASQVFTATLTSDSAAYDRNIKMEWISSTASTSTNTISYISIVRPFATASRIRELADIDSSTTNASLKKEEKKARSLIQSYTGVNFAKEYTSIVVYGNDSDVLTLPIPVIRIDKIYEDDILVYDSVSSASVNSFEYQLEPSVSKTRIKIINEDDELERRILEYPDIAVIPYSGVFKKDYQYKIIGIFGYEYVPSKVELACSLVVEDLLCNDWNIRNKVIQSMKTDSYDLQYAKEFAGGTGNLMVDSLLSEWHQAPRFMAV